MYIGFSKTRLLRLRWPHRPAAVTYIITVLVLPVAAESRGLGRYGIDLGPSQSAQEYEILVSRLSVAEKSKIEAFAGTSSASTDYVFRNDLVRDSLMIQTNDTELFFSNIKDSYASGVIDKKTLEKVYIRETLEGDGVGAKFTTRFRPYRTIDPVEESEEIERLKREIPDDPVFSNIDTTISEEERNCSASRKRFEAALSACQGKFGYCPGNMMGEFRDAVTEFDAQCLRRVNTTELPIELRPTQVLRSVGVLRNALDNRVFCGGVLVDKDTVITARHCFIQASVGFNLNYAYISLGYIYFHRGHDEANSAQIASLIPPLEDLTKPVTLEQDFVFLKLDKPIAGRPELSFRRPKAGERLWIPGYFEHHSPELQSLFSASLTGRVTPDWYSGLRATKGSKCIVLDSIDSCFVHTCQTVPGFSGAPIISLTQSDKENHIVVVGLQSRTQSASDRCSNRVSINFNSATIPSQISSQKEEGAQRADRL